MASHLGTIHAAPWSALYRTGAIAAIASVALLPIQIALYVLDPPPTSIQGWFALFQARPVQGLLAMDLLYVFNNVALLLMYLALFVALYRLAPSLMTIALALGLVAIAAYLASNPAFEMLDLARLHHDADTAGQRDLLLAAGHATLVRYTGTAFNAYYVLSAVALLLISITMLGTDVFSRATGVTGLIAGLTMLIPSTAGVLGMIFAFASLIPWAAFATLVALHLLRMR